MADKYLVTATFVGPAGVAYRLSTCCERDALERFAMLGRPMVLDQQAGLPRTCDEHRYDSEAGQ